MSSQAPEKTPIAQDQPENLTTELATEQTRRRILEILKDPRLFDLRSGFLAGFPENANASEAAIAIVDLKRKIYELDLDDGEELVELIDARTVLPSSRPPRSSIL